jgi:hypothetical protein
MGTTHGTEAETVLYCEVKRRFLPFLNSLKCQFLPFFANLLKNMQRGVEKYF